MRMNIEDRALRDPKINRRLPRFTGLPRFDAFGRLLHVWGLCYDQRSPIAMIEEVDDRAEHDGFALAMVEADLAERVDEKTIRIRGVEERIGYLVAASEYGQKGGETRAKQAAEGGRGSRGRFTKGPTTPPMDDDQGSTKGGLPDPLDLHHTSSSSSGSAPSPDQITAAPDLFPAEPSSPEKPDQAKAAACAVVERLNLRTGRAFRVDSAQTVKDCRVNLRAGVTVDDMLAVVEFKCERWLSNDKRDDLLQPSVLLRPSNVGKYLDEIRAGPVRAGPPTNGRSDAAQAYRPLTRADLEP